MARLPIACRVRLITHREFLFRSSSDPAAPSQHRGIVVTSPGIKSCVRRSILENDFNGSRDATTMFTNRKFVLSVAIILGTACAAQAAAQHPTGHQTGSIVQRQAPTSASGNDSFAPPPGQSTRTSAVYFDPNPAPFKAFTYCASVLLSPSTSKRVLQGEFRFPVFSATPNVSVQIISSTAAAPMQVHALKIEEISGVSGPVETQIVVEAETIFDVPAGGIYYANLVVTGVPVVPPTKANSAELLH
jgi:hypothetical protein